MNAMVLCPGCKRHVFASESACPFCGVGFVSTTHASSPTIAPELSRAQRYVVGAAIAASVATAGCSSPTVVHNPDEAGNVTVNVNETQSERQQRESLEMARDPNRDENELAAADAARRERELQAQREREERLRREEEQRRLREERDLEEGNRWRRHNPCVNGVCPPYGCVFPDEACDVFRV